MVIHDKERQEEPRRRPAGDMSGEESPGEPCPPKETREHPGT